jgi:putative glutamine amidotransferase
MNKPKIIISSGVNQDVDNYVNAIEAYDAETIIISPDNLKQLGHSEYDGLVLTGGGDISPELYSDKMKASNNEMCFGTSISRDKTEYQLVKTAIDSGKPILGICRGMQLLNVYFGGILIQNVNLIHFENMYKFRNDKKGQGNFDAQKYKEIESDFHHIFITLGSKFAAILGSGGMLKVNSRHHQGIGHKELSETFTASAYCIQDGIIEAYENINSSIIGVQFHPERTQEHPKQVKRIFENFVYKCRSM